MEIEPGRAVQFNSLFLDPYLWTLQVGGKRLVQKAEGYVATVLSGAVTYREGEATGALPGRLVRGPQNAA